MSLGRIAFAGTPDFAVPSLAALINADADVTLVLTQPDRPAGRGRRSTASPVKKLAQTHGCPLMQPARLSDPQQLQNFGHAPDLLVVVAYGLILPAWLLAWPKYGAVNVHASILPRWRGAAPIQRAILAGDTHTGISIMQMDAGLDTGPVFRIDATPIADNENASDLHDRLATLGAESLLTVIRTIFDGSANATPQDAAAATYAHKIRKSEAVIDWSNSASDIDRKVRGFTGWPVAETKLSDGRRMRIWSASPLYSTTADRPGTIVAATDAGIDVATGAGILRITRLQVPGGRTMAVGPWLQAHTVRDLAFVSP